MFFFSFDIGRSMFDVQRSSFNKFHMRLVFQGIKVEGVRRRGHGDWKGFAAELPSFPASHLPTFPASRLLTFTPSLQGFTSCKKCRHHLCGASFAIPRLMTETVNNPITYTHPLKFIFWHILCYLDVREVILLSL